LRRRLAPLAAAILLGGFASFSPAAAAAGRVNHPVPQESPAVGNYRAASTSDPEVLAAARFAARAEGRRRGVPVTLISVEGAERQVVAGANYRLRLKVRAAGALQRVDAVVYQDLKRQYSLTSWEAEGGGHPPSPRREVRVYLVALGDGGRAGRRIGCGDSLVPVARTVNAVGGATLRAALEELLAVPHEYDGRLRNFWRGDNLRLSGVSLRNGLATIRITGKGPYIAGVCDAPRITEQIRATARQFPTVRRVAVLVNGRPLARALR
jgi:hypothetical protein